MENENGKENEWKEIEYYFGSKKYKAKIRSVPYEETIAHREKCKQEYFERLEFTTQYKINRFEIKFEKWHDKVGLLTDMIEELELLFDAKRLPINKIHGHENPFKLTDAQYFFHRKEIEIIRDIHLNVYRKGNKDYVPDLASKGTHIDRYEYKEGLIYFHQYLIEKKRQLEQTPETDNPKPKAKQQQRTIEDEIKIAHDYISFMDGTNHNNKPIMEKGEFETLKGYVATLIKEQKLPDNIKPFDTLNTSKGNIRYTFYLIHKKLYGIKPRKSYFIDFLKQTFRQFEQTDLKTISTKFSVKPTNYDDDVNR